jgi:hypothetical protein
MAKASMILPDGTTVIIEGSPDEIKKIIALRQVPQPGIEEKPQRKRRAAKAVSRPADEGVNLPNLVNQAKSSDEFELIESNILDRTSLVDRILLPMYVAAKHISGHTSLTSGDISKFLSELGVNIAQPNVARTLSSTALKYVIGDKIRKKGQAVRYRLSRRGMQYVSAVIRGKSND